jgi:hypothetical protein
VTTSGRQAEVVAGWRANRAPRNGGCGVPPFRGGALTPVVVSRLSPGTQWAALRRERPHSPLGSESTAAGGGRRRALSTRTSRCRHVDNVRGTRDDRSFVIGPTSAPPPPAKRGLMSRLSRSAAWRTRPSNLVTRVSYPSYASISSRTSADLDALDDLDVAAGLSGPASVPQMADPPPGSAAVARTAAWAAATRATGMRKGEQET